MESYRLIEPYGLDPLENMPHGGTLLHSLFAMRGVIRATFPAEGAILDLLLSLGIDINATNLEGRTVLHIAAENEDVPENLQLLLERGA
ncbi:hypothetical protein AJ87_47375 [Rhizobium yanglingense]|nr:hypothetical protein AJ87_47375 [Rhizobium yanglingense]